MLATWTKEIFEKEKHMWLDYRGRSFIGVLLLIATHIEKLKIRNTFPYYITDLIIFIIPAYHYKNTKLGMIKFLTNDMCSSKNQGFLHAQDCYSLNLSIWDGKTVPNIVEKYYTLCDVVQQAP